MGADINQKDKCGNTALMMASEYGCNEVVELLIQKGADVNAESNKGWTALMNASRNDDREIVELLIQNGADANQKNNEGQNAMMVATTDELKKAIIDAVKKINIKENGTIIGSIKNLFERQEI